MEISDYRRYDYRLKNLVAASDDIRKFEALHQFLAFVCYVDEFPFREHLLLE